MATPTKATTAALDALAETVDTELAAAGERLQRAELSVQRARARYARLVEARTLLRGLR